MLKLPGGRPIPDVPVLGGKVLKQEEIVLLPLPLLRATVKISQALKDAKEKWAFGGDAAEITKGVNVSADHLEIVTTKAGTEEICKFLADYVTLPPAEVEKKLWRDAYVDAAMFPVCIKSHYSEVTVDKVKVEVYGDLQYNVGEWGWGDPVDYEAEYVNIVGANVPILPLRLKAELDMGLGWYDRVELISDALIRGRHRQ